MSAHKNKTVTLYEWDYLLPSSTKQACIENKDARVAYISPSAYAEIEKKALEKSSAPDTKDSNRWVRLVTHAGKKALQVTSYVGLIGTTDGTQIEVLPKIGRGKGTDEDMRKRLLEMLVCLYEFPHIKVKSAQLAAQKMPLLEVFIGEFLRVVQGLVQAGLRSHYQLQQDNLSALRGKLLIAQHLRENLFRPDRFFTEHDEFSLNRPENRLLSAALQAVLTLTRHHQAQARVLNFVFADIPATQKHLIEQDFARVNLDRNMNHYEEALAWARLILRHLSPLSKGDQGAPSLLFDMAKVFEAFVAKQLRKQLQAGYHLKEQAQSQYMVKHQSKDWFQIRPDLLLKHGDKTCAVLDTKWKVVKSGKIDKKYYLNQGDFYQLYVYGHYYLTGNAHTLVLIYPKTNEFSAPLAPFEFPAQQKELTLWVVPFCLEKKQLIFDGTQDACRVLRYSLEIFAKVGERDEEQGAHNTGGRDISTR